MTINSGALHPSLAPLALDGLAYEACRSQQHCGRNWTPRDIVAEVNDGETVTVKVRLNGALPNPLRVDMRSKAVTSGDASPNPLPTHTWAVGEHQAEHTYVLTLVKSDSDNAEELHKINLWPVELLADGTERALPKTTVWLRVTNP